MLISPVLLCRDLVTFDFTYAFWGYFTGTGVHIPMPVM